MPPRPTGATISYGPRRSPGERAGRVSSLVRPMLPSVRPIGCAVRPRPPRSLRLWRGPRQQPDRQEAVLLRMLRVHRAVGRVQVLFLRDGREVLVFGGAGFLDAVDPTDELDARSGRQVVRCALHVVPRPRPVGFHGDRGALVPRAERVLYGVGPDVALEGGVRQKVALVGPQAAGLRKLRGAGAVQQVGEGLGQVFRVVAAGLDTRREPEA